MAKFYIQSGNVSLVVSAAHAERAALWVVNRAIDKYFPVDDVEFRLVNKNSIQCVLKGLAEMDDWVAVSQKGLGRAEAGLFETKNLFATCCSTTDSLSFLFGQHGWNHE